MCNVGSPGHQPPLGEDRHCQYHVVEVCHATAVWVVGDKHITLFYLSRKWVMYQNLFHGFVQNADKSGDSCP
ncbi:hypothetical protein D3C75_1306020 [compost metagenome]